MGRAIVREPAVFLFDEPLSNLDAKLRVQMRVEIKRLQQRLRTTSVYVTHDQVEAMTLGDRLIVHERRPRRADRHPDRGLRAPGHDLRRRLHRLARHEHAAGRGCRPTRAASSSTAGACRWRAPSGRGGQDVVLGIRPEHVVLGQGQPGAVPFTVDFVEALGADTLVHGHLGSARSNLTIRLPGSTRVASGDSVPLVVPPDHLHLFDAKSGARI